MIKLKTFFRTFVKSLTQPSYYKEILKTKFSFSFKYLAFLVFLISLFTTVKFAFSVLPLRSQLPGLVEKIRSTIVSTYPDKLVVSIKSGKIFTNVKEPYFIDVPSEKKMHFIVIDTKGKVEDYKKYNSLVLVTDSLVVVPNSNENISYKVYPLQDILKDTPDGVLLNKEIYQKLSSQVMPYVDKLPVYLTGLFILIVVISPFLATVFMLGWYMAGLLLFSVLFLIIAKLMKKDLSYSEVYRLSMHAITLPILVSLVLKFPFVFSLVFLVFMIVILSKLSTK